MRGSLNEVILSVCNRRIYSTILYCTVCVGSCVSWRMAHGRRLFLLILTLLKNSVVQLVAGGVKRQVKDLLDHLACLSKFQILISKLCSIINLFHFLRTLLIYFIIKMLSSRLSSAVIRSSRGSSLAARAAAARSFASSSAAGSENIEDASYAQVAAAMAATVMAAATLGLAAPGVTMNEKASALSKKNTAEVTKWPHKRPTQKYEALPLPDNPPAEAAVWNDPPARPELPIIPLEEIEGHNDEGSMWFIFRGAVYDLTFFKLGHPGGTPRLLMAAGQDLEPYWEVYRQHLRGHVLAWMEKHRIGSLSKEDREKCDKNRMEFGDMYETDPIRDPNNLPCTAKPFCGEPRIDLLTKDYYTPNELFYVRNHLAVPDIDPEEYKLIVKGKGIKKHKFSLEDLKNKFPKHEVTTTLQCAGNRREDMHAEHAIFIAPHWVIGAMSTAKWGGARVRDVLKHVGVDVDTMALGGETAHDQIKHVQFEGYDTGELLNS
jgi:cytochrome b involved in lipid metabolism